MTILLQSEQLHFSNQAVSSLTFSGAYDACWSDLSRVNTRTVDIRRLLIVTHGLIWFYRKYTNRRVSGGCFTNVSRALQNNLAKINICRKSHLWWEFQAETLHVCPKRVFSLKFSWEVRFLQYTNFERMFWRARETLVKQPPDPCNTTFVTTSTTPLTANQWPWQPKQNWRHFPSDIFKWFFLTNLYEWITNEISLKFVPRFQLAIFQHWFR